MKTKTPYVKPLLLLFCFFLVSSSFVSVSAQLLFQTSFEGSNPFAGLSSTQACCSYSVAANSTVVHDGAKSFRAEVRRNDPAVSSGYRAEVTIPSVSDQGDMWYGYSTYFENFPGGGGGHALQWHPSSSTGSATLSLWVNDGKFDVCINPTGSGSVTHQSGPLKTIVSNRWYDLVWHVKWSGGSDGIIDVWIDGELYFSYRGPTATTGRYFKLGMNRWSMTNDWVIYYDNLKVGRDVDYNTVAPPTSAVPANQPPVARAGNDISLTLPTVIATLDASGSSDPDGSITSYSWSRISGPAGSSLLSPLGVTTLLTGLLEGSYSFKLTVTDNNGATASDTVNVNVLPLIPPPNQPPTVNAGNNISVTLPQNSVTLNGSAADSDGTVASYLWTRVSGPTTFTLGNSTSASTTLSNLVQGVYVFRLRATDNDGATATDDIQVTVNAAPSNQAPNVYAGDNFSITLPQTTATLNGTASDNDGTITNISWVPVHGPASTITNTGSLVTSVTGLTQGVYVYRLTVTDNDGATATDTVQLTVNAAPNQPPTVNAGNDVVMTLPVNSTTLNGTASDPDGNIASWSWSRVSGPTTFTFGSANAATNTVTNLVQGIYVFRLTVTDNAGASRSDNVQVTVNGAAPTNQPPTVSAGNNISITLPVNNVTLNGSATDSDGTIAGYGWTKISGPAAFAIATPAAASTSVTSLVQGVYVFRLTATDNDGATALAEVTVTVNAAPPANVPPVANAGNNVSVTLPINYTTLNGSGTDSDGSIAGYAWTRISGPTTFTLGNAAAASTSLTNLVQGTYVFRLTVRDNSGATATDDVTITVNAAVPVNVPPVARAGNDIVLTLPTSATTLNGSGSTDPDGNIVTYTWTRVSGPNTFVIASPGAATSALSGLVQGVYVFRLTVTDNSGATATDDVAITVNAAPNVPPVARAGNDITITLPQNTATLNGSASTDANGTITGYLWNRISGPSFAMANNNAAIASLSSLLEGVYVFRLVVTDNNGATDADTVKVTVLAAPNQPPVARAGANIEILLPQDSVSISGSTSTDPDGLIASYEWNVISGPTQAIMSGQTTSTLKLSGLDFGEYTVSLKVTDDDGATSTTTVRVSVKTNNADRVYAELYPNPAVSTINLRYMVVGFTGKVRLSILDSRMRVVKEETVMKDLSLLTKSIDVSRLMPGVYFLYVSRTDGKRTMLKFVKH